MILLEGSQALAVRPSDKDSVNMKASHAVNAGAMTGFIYPKTIPPQILRQIWLSSRRVS
jgi:hypothetical protein